MWSSFRPERVCVCVIVSMFGVRSVTECEELKFEICEGNRWESISSVAVAIFMFIFISLLTFIFGRLHLLIKIDV